MVCLGNICRSPLAEGILRSKINEQIALGKHTYKNWEVGSAGTSGHHSGEKPDKRSIKIAAKNNINITDQRSRLFSSSDFQKFDIIYVMDSSNYHNVVALAKTDTEKAKVKLIMNEVEPEMNIAVPDPYYGEYGFENVFEMLNKACDIIINRY